MADARGLKIRRPSGPCGFESHPRHHPPIPAATSAIKPEEIIDGGDCILVFSRDRAKGQLSGWRKGRIASVPPRLKAS